MRIFFGVPKIKGFRDVLLQLPVFNFEKLTRSTVVQCAYWKNLDSRVKELSANLICNLPQTSEIYFEYPVRPNERYCKASYTDIMLLGEHISVAIEAKRNEGKYESVRKWLSKGDKSNRERVLSFWHKMISPYSKGFDFDALCSSDVTYQSIHRTASACSTEKEHAIVLYQIFQGIKDSNHINYVNELRKVASLINPSKRLEFHIQSIKVKPKDEYYALELELKRGSSRDRSDRADLIREALDSTELFSFPTIEYFKVE